MSESTAPARRKLLRFLAGFPLLCSSCETSSHSRAGLFGALAGQDGSGDDGDDSDGGLRPTGKIQHGKASWYSIRTNRGRTTASGEPLSNSANTAAHRSLPFGTWVKVTNLQNNRSQVVRITDRGPYIRGRIIDVTIGVGERLGMVNAGVVPCTVEILEPRHGRGGSA